jgi:hypothetical protein
MDERPRPPSATWIAAQLALLCGFQAVFVVIVAAICIAAFPRGGGFVAAVVCSPAAMIVGIICALAAGRRIRR